MLRCSDSDIVHAMTSTLPKPVIEARKLGARYRRDFIWQDASFSIERGEFVGILGPNGAGKTTLFKLLLGLLPPATGELLMLGEKPKRGNARIGYVPQRHPVDGDMNIEALEFVRLGLSGNKWGVGGWQSGSLERRTALATLRTLDAEHLAARPLGVLSGGELQRVFLAQALVGQPDLLLLDEPLANLDVRRKTELVQLMSTVVQRQQVTALLIAHDINPLLPVLDRVVYVANGRVATGEPGAIITSEALSKLYGAPVEVVHDSRGRLAVLGIEEAAHHE